jgi:uncharacterized protein (TIGR02145 family)
MNGMVRWAVAAAAVAVGLGLMTAGCGKKDAPATNSAAVGSAAVSATDSAAGSFTDGRDGQTYKTVKIGDQTWMAENLNYQTKSGSWCYENKADNCKQYGRLYDWNTAMAVCMAGWHLPSSQEWNNLVAAAGGDAAGKKLKSKSGWKNNGNGSDDFGFSALPSGYRYGNGSFINIGGYGDWWTTADDSESGRAYYRSAHYDSDDVFEVLNNKDFGFSVRCLMGAPQPEKSEPESDSKNTEPFTDDRDGQKYKTVKIGNQTWMAQNLNYKPEPQTGDSRCYDNKESNCKQYGRLYDWNAAKAACPAGWHLPSRQEWNDLEAAAGGDAAGRALKSVSWRDAGGGNGADGYGFSALPGGTRYSDGSFGNLGDYAHWWTATEDTDGRAYYRRMYYDYDYVYEAVDDGSLGFSVRCVKE